MNLYNFNLRGIPPEIMNLLKSKARKEKTSVNALLLKLLAQSMGVLQVTKRNTYHDLDNLAGTWSKEDIKIFNKNTRYFEKIDEDMWK